MRPRRPLSLRARLLALQLAVFGGLVLLASPASYLFMSRGLQRERDEYLASMASRLPEELLATGEPLVPDGLAPRPCLPDPVLPGSSHPQATHRPRHLLLSDGEGRVLCSDGERLPLAPEAAHEASRTQAPVYADVRWSAEVFRLVAWPFRHHDGRILVAEVGTSYLVIERTLRRGLTFLAAIGGLALLLLLAGSLALTRSAFQPIDRIVRKVEHIDEGNLAERLSLETPSDETRRLVAVINRMLERLERAFEAQSRFSSDVAHEIRSPLTALRGQIEVALRRQRPADEYRAALEECLEEVLRLSRLAEDLMCLAKADAGALGTARGEVHLRELVARLLARFRTRADEKNIELRMRVPEGAAVVGDRGLLERCLENLVENALTHAPHTGEVVVAVQTDSKRTRISVADNGPGIPAEHLPRIFDRFYRVDAARSRDVGGTGLGLSIAQQIARLHSAEIEVSSEAGKGAVFTLTLPAAGTA